MSVVPLNKLLLKWYHNFQVLEISVIIPDKYFDTRLAGVVAVMLCPLEKNWNI